LKFNSQTDIFRIWK